MTSASINPLPQGIHLVTLVAFYRLIPFQQSLFARPHQGPDATLGYFRKALSLLFTVGGSGEPPSGARHGAKSLQNRQPPTIAIVPHLKPSSFENASRTPAGTSGRIAATVVAVRSDDRQMPSPRQARVL